MPAATPYNQSSCINGWSGGGGCGSKERVHSFILSLSVFFTLLISLLVADTINK
jgi:hypothetical protein